MRFQVLSEFKLELRFVPALRTSSFEVVLHEGCSAARLADGSAEMFILGEPRREPDASRMLETLAAGSREPADAGPVRVGCVLVSHAHRSVTVIAPRIGERQVYYATGADRLALAGRPRGLSAGAGMRPALRPSALYSYVYFHNIPGPECIFEGIAKLDGGHRLTWDGSNIRCERYWTPKFDEAGPTDEAEASARLHRTLEAAVARALANPQRTAGAFLSGGLDSSTVTGLAARLRPGVPTVTMGFDAPGYDEMDFARIASRRYETRPLEYYVTPRDVLQTLPAIAASFPEPFGNSSAAAAYQCARVAREHGIDLLLAGDGGDELFGGNERYSRQLVFERYRRLPAALRRGLLEPAVRWAARRTRRFPVGKAASYVEQANVPLPDRLQAYNFLHRHTAAEVFSEGLLGQADTGRPLRLLQDEYRVPATRSAVNRMLFLDWKFTLHDNDLVKVSHMCRLGGVDVAYPMLDPAVIDFSLTLPGDWKVRRGDLRWFYKRAMRGFLPDEIIAKRKHGFGLPFGLWMQTDAGLRALSEDALATLGERGFFRSGFLRDALRLHSEGHASYYGELVWILTVLELWLREHAPDARL